VTDLGTERHPVVVRVRSQERAALVAELGRTKGLRFIVGIEPDEPEDLTDLAIASGKDVTKAFEPPMAPLQLLLPEVASHETRTLLVDGSRVSALPSGAYCFNELYCVKPGCDCRRVMLWVFRDEERVATLNHAFSPDQDRDIGLEQTFLDPLHRQSASAPALLDLFKRVVCDPAYQARLERHYRQVKDALADPAHAIHDRLAAECPQMPRPIVRERVARPWEPFDLGLKKPCSCGSGKRYKHCCWRQ